MNAEQHPLMRSFHKPNDEKRSLVVVPADRREEWLQADDPSQFMRNFPAEEFPSRPTLCRRGSARLELSHRPQDFSKESANIRM